MKALLQGRAADVLAGALALAFAYGLARFAWQPGLASFADDSVSYLVMAQVFSPWQAASPAVAQAFVREAFYPPLFPAVLALLGAAHDMARAHAVTALLLAGCLPLVYVLGVRWLGSRWAALGALLATACLPLLWIQVKGILSEPLFALLLLAFFWAQGIGEETGRRSAALGALLAALVLTRAVGIAVAAGYAAWAAMQPGDAAARVRRATPALVAVAAYAAWVLVRPAATSDINVGFLVERSRELLGSDSALSALGASLSRQAGSMAEAWAGSLVIFWVEGSPARLVLAALVGVLALAGLAWRFVAGKADAWMSAAYLATFLVWPFYDQMTRFLFPIIPVLVLYAFWFGAEAGRRLRRPSGAAHALLAVVLLSLAVPALGFIHQRSRAPGRFPEIVDWYRTPDIEQARRRAQVHLDLMADMEAIRSLTRPEDRVMWVTPAYVALLADRRGVPAPSPLLAAQEYRQAVAASGATYVFLSLYHPRDTLRDAAWRSGVHALEGFAQTVHKRIRGEDGAVSSLLLRLPPRQPALLSARGPER